MVCIKAKPVLSVWMLILLAVAGNRALFGADFFKARESALKPGRWQLGPFQIFPTITLDNLGYTDNVYRYASDPQPGWMADIGVNIKAVSVIGRRFVLVLEGHPYYSYFSTVDTERALNHSLNARVYTWLGGIHLVYSVDYASLRWRPTNEFAAKVRNNYTTQRLEADIGNHSALFLTVYAGLSNLDFSDEGYMSRYDPEIRLNRTEQTAGVKLNLPLFTATLLSLQAELSDFDFDYSIERDGRSLLTALNLRFPEIGHLTGNASLGYKRYFPDNPAYSEFSTMYGSGHVAYRFLRRMRLGIDYNLDNYFSFISPEFYYNQKTAKAALDYYMSRNLRLGFSYLRGRYDYRQLADGALRFRDENQYIEFRVVFRLAGTTGVGLSFRREEWDSQRINLQRSYYFIGGYVTHDF
ncbi:MAG TPA: hypothetical protein ENN40_01740 [Candidatus Aminicenantes bacterium]|nr:hypothetical protein [Candidatus Aminicenantes bacterium]